MALTFGHGPFAQDSGSFDFPVPEHVRYWEPWPRRMRAVLGGRAVLDSQRGRRPPVFYPDKVHLEVDSEHVTA